MSKIGITEIRKSVEDETKQESRIQNRDRLLKGPVAIIECHQDIPCNVCERSCPHNAIELGNLLTNKPLLHEDKCVGCKECVPQCPGLAIFVVDLTVSEDYATFSFPYEFVPLPKPKDEVLAVNEEGKVVCNCRCERVIYQEEFDGTRIVVVRVPKEYIMEVRSIRLIGRERYECIR